MIRQATIDDIPRMLPMSQRFYNASGYSRFVDYSGARVEAMLSGLLETPGGILLVDSEYRAMMAALVFQTTLGEDLSCQELAWWSEDKGRGLGSTITLLDELMDMTETLARDLGAKTMIMMALEHLHPKSVGKMYRRRDYIPTEHTYMRAL